MSLTAPNSVIFDWDNTLVDTWPIIHTALNATLAAYAMPLWTLDMTKERVRKSMRDSFPELFGDRWEEAGSHYQKEYRKIHLEKLTPLPDVLPVLEHIKKRGLYCVVVSNKKGDNLRQEIEHLGWGHYFHTAIGSGDAAQDKPSTTPVEMAFENKMDLLGEATWFVGDSDIDLECAKNVGCKAILYGPVAEAHPHRTPTQLSGLPYDYFALNHVEALALFERFSE